MKGRSPYRKAENIGPYRHREISPLPFYKTAEMIYLITGK